MSAALAPSVMAGQAHAALPAQPDAIDLKALEQVCR
jgi:hypothetical protein